MTGPALYHVHPSPLGELLLTSNGEALTGLHLPGGRHPPVIGDAAEEHAEPFRAVCLQLDEYFAGRRQHFDIPLAPTGTPFQRRVWSVLLTIPFGQTRSYGEVALALGSPRAVRAVGSANGRNPIAVVIPCHRVIAADGSLGGYGGGLARKESLLALENGLRPASVRGH